MYLKVRIDGGPSPRLLLDSGAQHNVLDKPGSALSARSSGSTLDIVGLGSAAKTARRVTSGGVQIGDLILGECDIFAVDGKLLEGIDGVIPMSLFAGFLVHLDVPGKTLELEPYPPDPQAQDAGYSPVRSENALLFLQAIVNESQSGYVLLDTGATYNAVAPEAAGVWKNYRILSTTVSVRGGKGNTGGFLLPRGVRFRLGTRVVCADPAVVVDLSDIASHHKFAIAGVLGFPAVRRSVININYRDALVRMDGN